MSLLAAIHHALRFTEEQNRKILARDLTNQQLAERFGCSIRQIQRQRAFLKGLKDE
jgi:hypothetical protein